MDIHLSQEETEELRRVLHETLGDLSSEISGTDNAAYRAQLEQRRALLRHLHDRLSAG